MGSIHEGRTVKVSNVSLGASEQDIQEFFSFSGIIEYVEMKSESERSQTAFVTFKDTQGAETAVLLTASEDKNAGGTTSSAVQKAEDVVSSMLAKGFVLGKDAVNKAKAFDEKHQVISTATAKVASLDQKIGLSEKITTGAAIVNDKVKEVDQKFQVSEKTKSAFAAAEQTVSTAGSAIMKNRYVLTGASWVTGAFSRVTKTAGEVSQKTMEKVAEGQPGKHASEGYAEIQTTSGSPPKESTGDKKKPSSPKGLIL
ncbi:RNA-binding (RRM/RBD/RNP motifs) family protein [Striga asiatica]|uniref:RNA-binding (RRM/RBD/RNP motifs) family protein n=1 Tax=Striga asiatica TaxID=4170 RepID=A0A5A7PLF6_STRAF|nr:RNA-binding (RRM/RBD/RNP motifs) family protein [Striga asiatica]